MTRLWWTKFGWSALAISCLCLAPSPAAAQLMGFNIKGDQGMKAGTQAPVGAAVGAPLYWYNTATVKNDDGLAIQADGDFTMFLGGPLFTAVTPKKILGAHYGFLVVLPFANARLELPIIDQNPEAGVSDLYIQPINLGWHTQRFDVLTGYGFFAPIGRYEAGARNNTGLGMWGHEVFLGTTAFLDHNKAWHAATIGSLEFHTAKEGTDAQVGNLLTLEGGVGRDFLRGAARAGLAYYAQWKVSDDELAGLPSLIVEGRNSVAALGPELVLPIASKKAVYGFVTARYQWEMGARTTTQGDALTLTFVFPLKPIQINP